MAAVRCGSRGGVGVRWAAVAEEIGMRREMGAGDQDAPGGVLGYEWRGDGVLGVCYQCCVWPVVMR